MMMRDSSTAPYIHSADLLRAEPATPEILPALHHAQISHRPWYRKDTSFRPSVDMFDQNASGWRQPVHAGVPSAPHRWQPPTMQDYLNETNRRNEQLEFYGMPGVNASNAFVSWITPMRRKPNQEAKP